jgi:hypothetical protein
MTDTINFTLAPLYFIIVSAFLFYKAKTVKHCDQMSRLWWSEDYWQMKKPVNTFPEVVKVDGLRVLLHVVPIWIWTIIGIFTPYSLLHLTRIVIGTILAEVYDKRLDSENVYFARTYYLMSIAMFVTVLFDHLQIIHLPEWAKYQF